MQTPGFAGSWMSHQAVTLATPLDQSVLIFEDDAVPGPDFEARCTAMLEQLSTHDPDWEGVWMGYAPGFGTAETVAPNLLRHHGPLNTHAYALRGDLLAVAQELQPQAARISHWDGALQKLADTHRVYGPHHGTLVGQACWEKGTPDDRDNYHDFRV